MENYIITVEILQVGTFVKNRLRKPFSDISVFSVIILSVYLSAHAQQFFFFYIYMLPLAQIATDKINYAVDMQLYVTMSPGDIAEWMLGTNQCIDVSLVSSDKLKQNSSYYLWA